MQKGTRYGELTMGRCLLTKARAYAVQQVTLLCLLMLGLLILGAAGCLPVITIPQTGCYKKEGLDPKVEAVFEEFRASVPAIMRKGKVPGVAIALVDQQGIIWTEGFGYTDYKRKILVTPDTPFLICSMSKTVTATAVMLAVQDGLLDLDEPITTYLPDFRVNSRYEENPEQKITLRHLLSHTAGLCSEPTIGNYAEPEGSFEEHVRSIYGTWLIYPVGQAHQYTNASIDLAAYILQVVSGMPFEQYMKERLFRPLGMPNSTIDSKEILSNSDRAIGHEFGLVKLPPVLPLIGAGGVYTSSADFAKFVQLHINKGTIEGKRILDDSLIDAMHTPKGVIGHPDHYYGLGIHIDKRGPEKDNLLLHHEGGGYGFASFMHWYPEYGIGTVVLTNKGRNPVLGELAFTLPDRLIKEKIVERCFPQPRPDYSKCVGTWWGWSDHNPTHYKLEWSKYCGTYRLRISSLYKFKWWGGLALRLAVGWPPRIKVYEKDGFLCVTECKFVEKMGAPRHVDQRLQEHKPGLFFAGSGIPLDFTSEVPTWRNYRLKNR